MRKFKKFYIALLGAILALGVGTGSLVSSVSPTSVKASSTVTETYTFSDSTFIGDVYHYTSWSDTINYVTITLTALDGLIENSLMYYYYYSSTSFMHLGASASFALSTSRGVITQVKFTLFTGSVIGSTSGSASSSFSTSYDTYTGGTSFSVDQNDENTLIFNNVSSLLLYVTGDINIRQLAVTLSLSDLEEAEEWAESFNNGIICDEDGVNEPSGNWSSFASSYNALSDEAKAYFEDDREENQSTIIEEAIKKYDYIVTKYEYTGRYDSFIDREPVVDSANTISSVTNSIDYITIIAIVVSVVALTSIAAFIIIYRKRKLSSK